MCRRALFLLCGCAAAISAAAQAPDERSYYYPYAVEPEERTEVPPTDSALFYRAVQSAEDLFSAQADYRLSFVGWKRRGQERDMTATVVEGLSVAARYEAALRSLFADEYRFAGMAGASDAAGLSGGVHLFRFGERAPSEGQRASVSFSGRNWLMGAKYTLAALPGRHWEVVASVQARTGRDLYVDGVFTQALTAAVAATGHFGEGHRLTLLAVVPPSMRGLRSASTEEAFALTGDNLYNPSWGFQNGKVRNAHVRRDLLPLAVASYEVRLSPSTSLAAAFGAEAGVSRYSALTWFDVRTPMPDNYRYMPSYAADPVVEEVWRARDPRYTQIDWSELYMCNRMASDGHAVYAQEDRVERLRDLQLRVRTATEIGTRLILRCGVSIVDRNVRRYKEMRDLLGADHIIDVDYWQIDDELCANKLQNDLRRPNRTIREGDRFGYDYALSRRELRAELRAEYRADRLRIDLDASAGETAVHRYGYFEKELFPGAGSRGPSRRLRFSPYLFKLRAGWSFSPRSYLEFAAMAAAVPPEAADLFLQPEYNNRTVDRAVLERIEGAELSFRLEGRTIDLQLAAYVVQRLDGTETRRYYDDLAALYCDMAVTGIGTRSYGLEAAVRLRLGYRWQLALAAAAGRAEYVRDPQVTIVSDADNEPVDDAVSRMGGCRVGGAPELAGCLEASHFAARGWGFRIAASFAGSRYVEPAWLRRTARVARQSALSEETFHAFVAQERLDDAFSLDASLWKTFRFGSSQLTCSLALRNLTGDRSTVTYAYESLRVHRLRAGDETLFAPYDTRRLYAYPRSVSLTVSYRF